MKSQRFVLLDIYPKNHRLEPAQKKEGLDKRTCFDDVDGSEIWQKPPLNKKNLNLHIFLEKWREAWHIQWVSYTYFVQQVPS